MTCQESAGIVKATVQPGETKKPGLTKRHGQQRCHLASPQRRHVNNHPLSHYFHDACWYVKPGRCYGRYIPSILAFGLRPLHFLRSVAAMALASPLPPLRAERALVALRRPGQPTNAQKEASTWTSEPKRMALYPKIV